MKMRFAKYWIAGLMILTAITGCSSIPDSQTISPSHVANARQRDRSNMDMINFIRLRQDPPDAYRLGPGDTLGIYIETITGAKDEPIPVHQPPAGTALPPAVGYPFTVRDDGTLSLPLLLASIPVEGSTLMEAEEKIRRAYMDVQQLLKGSARITVSLIRPRTYHVVVIREDVRSDDMRFGGATNNTRGSAFVGTEDRGTAKTLEMWAYQNDVLNALNQTGGMPSSMAKNEVIILRGAFADAQGSNAVLSRYHDNGSVHLNDNPNVVRIPLRAKPGQMLPELSQEDIILRDGDVVVIQSREAEVFYTGGLLQGGMYPIPRDFDLDVFGAISMAGGSVAVAAGGSSNFRGSSVGTIVPPTRLLVIREINGYQRAIKIDMRQGLVDNSQRILIQPNDLIVLEYTPAEVMINLFMSTFQLRLDLQSLWN